MQVYAIMQQARNRIFISRMVQHPNILCVLGSVLTNVQGSNLHNLLFCHSTKVIGESKSKIGESKSKIGLNYEHKRKEK